MSSVRLIWPPSYHKMAPGGAMREIRCIGCGKINRIPRYSVRFIPRCAACHIKLPEPRVVMTLRGVYQHRGRLLLAFGVVAGIALAFVPDYLRRAQPPAEPPADLVKVTPPPLDFSKEARTPAPIQDACIGHEQPESRRYAVYIGPAVPAAPLRRHRSARIFCATRAADHGAGQIVYSGTTPAQVNSILLGPIAPSGYILSMTVTLLVARPFGYTPGRTARSGLGRSRAVSSGTARPAAPNECCARRRRLDVVATRRAVAWWLRPACAEAGPDIANHSAILEPAV